MNGSVRFFNKRKRFGKFTPKPRFQSLPSTVTSSASEKVRVNSKVYIIPLLLHSRAAEIPTDTLIVELQRRGFDASSLIAQTQPQRKQATASAKVIPISQARRTLQVGSGGVQKAGG